MILLGAGVMALLGKMLAVKELCTSRLVGSFRGSWPKIHRAWRMEKEMMMMMMMMMDDAG